MIYNLKFCNCSPIQNFVVPRMVYYYRFIDIPLQDLFMASNYRIQFNRLGVFEFFSSNNILCFLAYSEDLNRYRHSFLILAFLKLLVLRHVQKLTLKTNTRVQLHTMYPQNNCRILEK